MVEVWLMAEESERPHRHTEGKPGTRCTTVSDTGEEPWPASKLEVEFSLPFTQDSMREESDLGM